MLLPLLLQASQLSHLNSNNPLAVELETAKDARHELGIASRRSRSTTTKAARHRTKKDFLKMIRMLTRGAVQGGLLAVAVTMMAATAVAQQPTEAQRDAIRSDCRSDYIAHCSSVPPGGAASLQCLQKNMSSLSASCQRAVKAVEAPAAAAPAPKAETPAAAEPARPAEATAPKAAAPAAESARPAAPAAKSAATPAAPPAGKKPSDAQLAALRSACRADYQKNCASVPPGGAASLSCLETNKAKLSTPCQQAVNAASGGATAAAPAAASSGGGAAAPTAAVPAVTPLVLRPMLPREELFVLRSACSADVRGLCAGVAPGGGRIMQCLAVRAASLSPACRDVLAQFAAQ